MAPLLEAKDSLKGHDVTNSENHDAVELQIRTHCAAGEREKGATLLVETYGGEILRFILSRLRDPAEASEAFSQFTEDLWNGLGGFRWQCTARTWAYTLARHAASRHVASARRRHEREVPLSPESGLHDVAQRVRTRTLNAARTEMKNRVDELREQLPLDDQTLIVLRVSRRLDWKEIARVMIDDGDGATERELDKEAARLRKRFQTVKEKLRELVAKAGLVSGESGPFEE